MSTFHGLACPYPAQSFRGCVRPADAILAILCVVWPRGAAPADRLVLLLAVGTLVLTPLTTSAGDGCRLASVPRRRAQEPRATRLNPNLRCGGAGGDGRSIGVLHVREARGVA